MAFSCTAVTVCFQLAMQSGRKKKMFFSTGCQTHICYLAIVMGSSVQFACIPRMISIEYATQTLISRASFLRHITQQVAFCIHWLFRAYGGYSERERQRTPIIFHTVWLTRLRSGWNVWPRLKVINHESHHVINHERRQDCKHAHTHTHTQAPIALLIYEWAYANKIPLQKHLNQYPPSHSLCLSSSLGFWQVMLSDLSAAVLYQAHNHCGAPPLSLSVRQRRSGPADTQHPSTNTETHQQNRSNKHSAQATEGKQTASARRVTHASEARAPRLRTASGPWLGAC